MPEILFTMMQGSYTTQSHPFSIDGWLKWFVKDTLWYPMWNKPYIRGAGEAIPQAIMLKRRQISADFGQDLKQPSTSQRMRSPSRSRASTRGGTRSCKSRLSASPSRVGFSTSQSQYNGLGDTEPSPGEANRYEDDEDFKDYRSPNRNERGGGYSDKKLDEFNGNDDRPHAEPKDYDGGEKYDDKNEEFK
jgi:hypothetical protein